jgi:hypothetical protein
VGGGERQFHRPRERTTLSFLPGRAAPAASDIDAPVFAESRRVIGEDDLAVTIGIEGFQSLPQ